MKKRYTVFLVQSLLCAQGDFVIDTVKAIVEGPVRTELVLESDISRRAFDGVAHTVQDIAVEVAKNQRGEELGLSISNELVDQYLRASAQGTDVSQESLISMGSHFGYANTDEFYTDLKRLYGANTTMDTEVRSFLAVSEQEISNYYKDHPEYKEGVYYLQTAYVPFHESLSHKAYKKALENPGQSDKVGKVQWSIPFDITYSELAADKKFIEKMDVGDIHAVEQAGGFELFKLKNHIKPSEVSLNERRQKILETIREEKFNKKFNSYNEEIMKTAVVTYY